MKTGRGRRAPFPPSSSPCRSRAQFYAEGDSSAAGITLTTDEELFFTDINAEGLERRQSYVEYGGYRFRVAGTGFMQKNTLHNIYACVRYFE
ncbi:MAG: hypothetical protein ACLR7Z_17290 [Bilophila wadsworthia]